MITTRLSSIIRVKDGNSRKKIIQQYKIGEWEKQENVEILKAMLR